MDASNRISSRQTTRRLLVMHEHGHARIRESRCIGFLVQLRAIPNHLHSGIPATRKTISTMSIHPELGNEKDLGTWRRASSDPGVKKETYLSTWWGRHCIGGGSEAVFVDNGGLAHSTTTWYLMNDV